jgi:hypothetical protein
VLNGSIGVDWSGWRQVEGRGREGRIGAEKKVLFVIVRRYRLVKWLL